jgi:hypothetical protein
MILIACEYSGIVRDAFTQKGFKAMSCDILPTETEGEHYQGDILDILHSQEWDLVIAHPPCTYLSSSGLHWNNKVPGRAEKTEEALKFVELLWNAPTKKMCLENPVGCINTRLAFMPKPQYIQPYEFGEDASKKTGLWLRGLPKLIPTNKVEGREVFYGGKTYRRWANQTDSGQNKLGPSEARAKDRSKTYSGIANAMAEQWSKVL